MDLLQLRYFRVVARREHMTKAAEELCIAQPSLSKTIRRLEKEIGVPLFDRQERSLQLNQFGKAFLEHIEAMFSELEEGQRKVQDMAGLEQGVVSLIAASLPWIPDLLYCFQILHLPFTFAYPNVHLLKYPSGSKRVPMISASYPLRSSNLASNGDPCSAKKFSWSFPAHIDLPGRSTSLCAK
ncbi:hypothetical protein KSB_60760 [Ktedonobacter robiniae]|uniref:HTH lysR-type domain-containing protein n=1 Tax=Ktedonobacter robiniae TaxID=2778365 RepID=A0ABQ3UY32_9CHLR|nr:hypothetical protein KSB_60760 [Ktedonobacter robiniae]